MAKICFIVSIGLAIMFALLSMIFGFAKRKSAFLLIKFYCIPKEERKMYNVDKMVQDASDNSITFFFYMFVCAAIALLSTPVVALILLLMFFAFVVWLLIMDAREVFKDYRFKE